MLDGLCSSWAGACRLDSTRVWYWLVDNLFKREKDVHDVQDLYNVRAGLSVVDKDLT